MIKIEIDDREVRAALEFLSRRVSDMTPAMHRKYQAFGACRSELGMSSMPWTLVDNDLTPFLSMAEIEEWERRV